MHSGAMYKNMLRKELIAASTEPLILALLARGESYGYALIQDITTRSQKRIEWTDGMLYPVLHRMERRGWIESRWGESETGRKRKYYSIRAEGRAMLGQQFSEWTLVNDVLSDLAPDDDSGSPLPAHV